MLIKYFNSMDRNLLPSTTTSAARHWMVIYTRSKYEKKVDQLLKLQNIRSFCPVVKTRRKWADRYKTVDLPLFNSYVFVYVTPQEQARVLQTVGVVNFVYFCNKPAIVPSSDIERIQSLLNQYTDLETVSVNSLKAGDPVVFKNGILFDHQGEVLEVRGKSVLIVIRQLDCALVAKVKVDMGQVHVGSDFNRPRLVIHN